MIESRTVLGRGLLLALMCLGLLPGPAAAQSLVWQKQMEAAEVALARGQLAVAERAARAALEDAQRSRQDVPTALSLNMLAGVYRAQGRRVEAEPLLRRAMTLAEQARGPAAPELAKIVEDLATLLRETNRGAEAERLQAEANEKAGRPGQQEKKKP